ncbi:DUF4383 domain-containing protein [Amnibacterium sp. CER49]|uniref:DUF4383 domain-containing protein n=1 Tax=Amnibacterium sp. CER49 TaxID=3039161 RepID=UPI00244D6645|nr:DUF4383 domain-containing protein [Amnibacterium sp. CER49]MDH2443666.1 DUF4383 domain-containing protein [Amnibacterium sp. CER49]
MGSSPNRLLATIFGAVYLLVGLIGFFWTSGVPFAGPGNGSSNLILGIFEVNPLHNVAHLLIGAALLIAGTSNVSAAKATNTTIGAAYLLLGIVGFFLSANHSSAINFLSLNVPDHFLHLASAIVLLAVGLGADRAVRGSRAATV